MVLCQIYRYHRGSNTPQEPDFSPGACTLLLEMIEICPFCRSHRQMDGAGADTSALYSEYNLSPAVCCIWRISHHSSTIEQGSICLKEYFLCLVLSVKKNIFFKPQKVKKLAYRAEETHFGQIKHLSAVAVSSSSQQQIFGKEIRKKRWLPSLASCSQQLKSILSARLDLVSNNQCRIHPLWTLSCICFYIWLLKFICQRSLWFNSYLLNDSTHILLLQGATEIHYLSTHWSYTIRGVQGIISSFSGGAWFVHFFYDNLWYSFFLDVEHQSINQSSYINSLHLWYL